ncbi:MAG TPA: LLM class flavin-dependent oxidoreductase [Acidimicrobiales bacterium]|nr:LLM class flavin-dependent oxidoreductase [Acidimicrobiales bacterium]
MYLLRFDMRLGPDGPTTARDMYQAALDMAGWADDAGGCLSVLFSEHHGSPDGYLPAPLVMAAAVAARTRRVPLQVAALIATLRNPVQTAEELAVLDILSGGRLSVVLGVGYRPEEFDLFGVSMDDRAARIEEAVSVFRRAWAGEPVSAPGGRGPGRPVTPLPLTPGGPPLFLGGGTRAAVRRAARLGLGMMTERGGDLEQVYRAECAAHGRQPGLFFSGGDRTLTASFVDPDPDAAWDRIGPYLLRDARAYAEWNVAAAKPLPGTVVEVATVDDVRAAGRYRIMTPDEAVAYVRTTGPLMLHPLCGGTPPALGWPTLQLVEQEVLPQLGHR